MLSSVAMPASNTTTGLRTIEDVLALICSSMCSSVLPLLSQLFSVQGGEGTPNLPKGGPGLLCPAGGFGMLRRNVQRAALAILSISNVEVWSVEVLGGAIAGTTGIAATARGLRQATLDHGFRSTEELLYEPLLLTHDLILR